MNRRVFAWIGVEAAALAGIACRYDWSSDYRRFAWRGWLLSGYLCVVALPVVYGLARRRWPSGRAAVACAVLVGTVLALPYRLIGLDRIFFYRARVPPWYNPPTDVPFPRTQFLPGGPWSTFPHALAITSLALVGTVCVGVAVCWRWRWRQRLVGRAAGVVVAVLAVIVQCFLHSGVRGPYAYMTHFQGPPRDDLWYVVAHFPDGRGVTIADQFVFSALEQYFHGVAVDPNNMLIRRPLAFYGAAQFSYFFNTFYVWTIMNALVWVAAVGAGYGFVCRVASRRRARLFAAMLATGPGFVAFASTPGMYLAGFAVVIIALFLLEWLLVGDGARVPVSQAALCAAAVGLCALTYDLTIFFPAFGAYLLARRVPLRVVAGTLVGAYLVYRGFLFLHDNVLGIEVVNTNTVQLARARAQVTEVLGQPSQWFGAGADAIGGFATMSARMFFYVPLVLALPGLLWIRDRAQRVLVGGLVLTTFATVAFLRVGGELIGSTPRFTYPMYPAVYLLAATALDRATDLRAPPQHRSTRHRRGEYYVGAPAVRICGAVVVIGLLALLANIDSLGYPKLYYEALEGTEMGTFLTVDPASGKIVKLSQ